MNKMKIDFQSKKTEYEWQKSFDKFWLKFTHQWFEWLGWILIVGAITYLSEKSNNFIQKATKAISYLLLFFYFQSYFYSIEFYGILWVKKEKTRRVISIVISGFLAILIYLFFKNLILELKNN